LIVSATPTADVALERLPKAALSVSAAKSVAGRSPAAATTRRDAAIDYVRAFVTVIVVTVHSVAGYALVIPAAHPHHAWLTGAPVADTHRMPGVDLFMHVNDDFCMALMFFVSGVFVWPSLARKGSAAFLRDRVLRLGLPYVVALLLMPIAFYAAYRALVTDASFAAFLREWLSLGFWPCGPLWFIPLLFGYDAIAVALHRLAPGPLEHVGRWASNPSRRPLTFFAALIVVSGVAYLPMQLAFGADSWVKFGPVFFQTSRLLLYGVYFFAGAVLGANDIRRTFIGHDGRLAQQWPAWTLAAVAIVVLEVARIFVVSPMAARHGFSPLALHLMSGVAFVLCCGTISFAVLALFLRFANTHVSILDSFSRSAYGIYLVHYGFVLWLQYALLPLDLPAAAKAATVLMAALLASWMTIAALRRIPAVARVL
jgi:hypothetical protein